MKIYMMSVLMMSSLALSAQELGTEFPKLTDYYLKIIRSHTTDSLLLPLSDTLFIIAGEELNPTIQGLALGYKTDYYYYLKDEQNLKFWVDSTKSFCKKHDVKAYYYFSWQRLVNYYIRKDYLTYAMQETEKMLQESKADNYYAGILDSEKALGRILFARGMYQESKETRLRVIKLLEEAPEGSRISNAHSVYLDLYQALDALKEYDQGEKYLSRALEVCRNDNQRNNVYGFFCEYYLAIGRYDKAKVSLDKAFALQSNETNPIPIQTRKILSALIQAGEGNYTAAIRNMSAVDTAFCDYRVWLTSFAKVYESAGMYKEADYYLSKLDRHIDSISITQRRIGMEESFKILNVGQLQKESDDLEYQKQRRQFILIHIAANGLLLSLIIMVVIFIFSATLKRRLKAAEKLNKAFLQHLSHEVRTPLNALVGFTDLIAESLNDTKLKMDALKLQKRTNDLINLIADTVAKIGLILLLCAIPLSAYGNFAHDENYYKKKLEETQGTSMYLAYCDSLYFASLLTGNALLQCESMSYKQNHFCNLMLSDSVKIYTDKAKEFALSIQNLSYYYHYWQQYVNYLTTQRMYSEALLETEMMQNEAMQSNYYPGQVEAEEVKGNILLSASLYDEAVETYSHALELANHAPTGISIPDIYQIYLSCAQSLIGAGEYDSALAALDKAMINCSNDAQTTSVYMLYSYYHRENGNLTESRTYLDRAVKMGYGKRNVEEKRNLLKNEIQLEIAAGDFQKALILSDSLKIVGHKAEYAPIFISLYQGLGRYDESVKWNHLLIGYRDSISQEVTKGMVDQQITQMDVNKLRFDNNKKSMAIQKDNVSALTILLFSLIFLTAIFLILALKNRRNNRRLKASNKIKTEFLRILSKDIKRPLDDIVRISDDFSTEASKNEDLCEYAGTIRECNSQLIKLVYDSMDMTEKYSPGKREFAEINSCLYLSEDYMDLPLKDGVLIKMAPHPDNPFVMMDKHKVVKILANLLHNAAKFTYKGEIVIKAETVGKEVVYSVTDTGIGIPKERREEVFEYFTKIDTMSQGLGLGLPLCKKLAANIGGTIKLDEGYSDGCRFVLRFPLE